MLRSGAQHTGEKGAAHGRTFFPPPVQMQTFLRGKRKQCTPWLDLLSLLIARVHANEDNNGGANKAPQKTGRHNLRPNYARLAADNAIKPLARAHTHTPLITDSRAPL